LPEKALAFNLKAAPEASETSNSNSATVKVNVLESSPHFKESSKVP